MTAAPARARAEMVDSSSDARRIEARERLVEDDRGRRVDQPAAMASFGRMPRDSSPGSDLVSPRARAPGAAGMRSAASATRTAAPRTEMLSTVSVVEQVRSSGMNRAAILRSRPPVRCRAADPDRPAGRVMMPRGWSASSSSRRHWGRRDRGSLPGDAERKTVDGGEVAVELRQLVDFDHWSAETGRRSERGCTWRVPARALRPSPTRPRPLAAARLRGRSDLASGSNREP